MAGVGRVILLLTFAVLAGQAVFAFGKREESPANQPAPAPAADARTENLPRFLGEMTVSGAIRRVGGEPFSRLVISDAENRDWYIDQEEQHKLAGFEQRNVSVRGRAFAQDMLLANGKRAGVQYSLRDIALVK